MSSSLGQGLVTTRSKPCPARRPTMPQATRPTSFNPDGQPNRTPVGYDLNHANPATWYPVFLDPNLDQQPDPRTFWTLGRFGALHPNPSFLAWIPVQKKKANI